MEAKDTVMGQYTIKNTLGLDFGNEVWKTIQPLLIAQAEISFKAGMKEVVEWIEGDCPHDHINGPRINCFHCMGEGLEAQKKIWLK